MEAIIFYLLKSAGILAIFFISYQLFLKNETFFRTNRHFLLAGILGSLLLPLVIFTNYVYVEPIENFNPYWLLTDIPITNTTVVESEPFNWFQFAAYTYLIGVLVFTIRFTMQLTSLFKLFISNTINKKDGFNLVEISANISPFSFFNYIVYNPKNYYSKDLEIIINHEKAHSNQLHSIDVLLAELFVILQWFNPFAWFYKNSIQQNLEFMADQFAISKVESSKHYQHTLLKASLKPEYASITNNFYNSLIKKRIIMLNQTKSNIKNTWKYFVILPALALFLMSFNVETVEVEKPSRELPTSSDLSIIASDKLINKTHSKTTKNIISNDKTVADFTATARISKKIIEIKIDKNTTDTELKSIASELKKDGIDFNFKNVKRNSNNEIIAINVTYKDKDGSTGSYALSSENPISTFYFYKEENGSVGFKSENVHQEHRLKVIEERELSKIDREQMKKEREHMMEEHKAMSKERRHEIEVRVMKAREKHKDARKEYEKQRKYIIKERIKLDDSLKYKKHGNVFIIKEDEHSENDIFSIAKEGPLFIVDGEESNKIIVKSLSPEIINEMNVLKGEHAVKIYGDKGKDGVVIIKTNPHSENNFVYEFDHDIDEPNVEFIVDPNIEMEWVSEFGGIEIQTLDKNTSDEDLKAIKSDFKSKDIDFKYSKVKRNNKGEITRIKVSLNDNEGDKTSATFNHINKHIPLIILGKNRNNLFIKSN